MAENNVEIKFRTTAELEGARSVQRELERTRGRLLALGESTTEVDAKLARVGQLLANTQDLTGKDFRQATDAIKETEHAGVALNDVLTGLGIQFRILPRLARIFFSPIALTFAAVTASVIGTVRAIEAMNRAMELSPWKGNKEAAEAQAKAVEQSRVASQQFQRELNQLGTEQDRIRQATDEATDALRRQEAAQRSIIAAEEALALARINAAEKAGILDEAGAASERFLLQERFAERRRRQLEQNAAAEVAILERQQEAMSQALVRLDESLMSRRIGLEKMPAADSVRQRLRTAQDDLKAAQDSLKKLEAEGPTAGFGAFFRSIFRSDEQRAAIREQTENQRALVDNLKIQVETFSRLETARVAEAKEAQAAIARNESEIKSLVAKRAELERTIEAMKRANAETAALRQTLSGIQTTTRATEIAPTVAGPPSPFGGTRDRRDEFTGTRDVISASSGEAARQLREMGSEIVDGFRLIQSQTNSVISELKTIKGQIQTNRP